MDEEEEKKQTEITKEANVEQAKAILLKTLDTDVVPFLWGPPGVGKSSMIAQICAEKKWDLIDLRLSLLNPVDLRGLPVINRKNKLAEWYHPSFLPNSKNKKPGILFLDEINLAPLSVQAAAYQLLLDKRVGEYRFPAHWRIVAAGNRETDRANVYKISAPLANRFFHITIQPDFNVWLKWATEKNKGSDKGRIRKEILSFLTLRPMHLLKMPTDSQKAFPSPRSWDFLSQLFDAYGYKELDEISSDLEQLIIGTIGQATGKEFVKFLGSQKLKDIPSQLEEFIRTGEITLPSQKDQDTRFSIITAICNSHREGAISKERYDQFLKKILAEEREAIKKIEEEGI